MRAAEIIQRLNGKGRMCKCPAHEDRTASLSVTDGDKGVLLKCFAGCETDAVCNAIGITVADLFYEKRNGNGHQPEIVATYDYEGFQVVRLFPKNFRQRRSDGNGGWIWNMDGIERVLFRRPEIERDVKRGLPIFVCEGEKDVLAMVERGFSATCNPGGTGGGWKPNHSESLRGANVIIIPDNDDAGAKHAVSVSTSLEGIAGRVRTIELPKKLNGKTVKDSHDFFAAGGTPGQLQDIVDSFKTLAERIQERRFNILVRPAPAVPRFFVIERPTCTPGNITALSAIPKGGKSAWVSAMMAAPMAASDADCLGVTSSNPEGKAVVHLDTEQSPEDHWTLGERTLRRAKVHIQPTWFESNCLTGFPIRDAREALPWLMAECARKHAGIHSVFIDGVADLAFDVNDPAEASELVCEWHSLAIKYACPIIGVIHLNPGTEKTRGHLGSQLERKSETNLKLERDGDAIVVWADKNRRAPIPKSQGPRFAWSDEAQMHVSIENAAASKENAERKELISLAERVFSERPAMKREDLEATFKKLLKVSDSTAYRKVCRMIDLTFIKKDFGGQYVFNGKTE